MTRLEKEFFPLGRIRVISELCLKSCKHRFYKIMFVREGSKDLYNRTYDFLTEDELGRFDMQEQYFWEWELEDEGIHWERVEERCDESES